MAVGVHAGSAYVDIQGDLRPLRRDLAAAGGPMGKQMGKLGGQLGSQLTRALGAGVKVGAVAVAGGLVYAVKKAADFEGQLSSLGAVSDATGKQMGTLRKQALKAGADTKFSALEAAQAQTELAKGGLKVSQIMRGGLKSSLALAAAGELDLATAAETTVNAMKLFGLHGKDSMQVADALATAANKTTADVEDFAMALKMGGSVAKLAGLDLQQTVTILESLAEAGIKNSDAGTSLKSFFLNIATPSLKASEAMEELGVELFDTQGNLKSLPAIAENLRGAFGHLTREQFLNKAGTIAGSDAIRTLYSLYAAGPDKLRGFEKGLNKQGTAVEVARKKQDNLKGSLEQLRGSAETFGITVGSEMIPAIRGGADELTDFTNKLSKIVQRDDLDVGQKLSRSFELAKVEVTPWIHKLEKALDEADIPEHLGDAVSAATPVIAEHLAKAAPKAANAFFDAWRESDVWGKLVIGGFLLHKMGGLAAFRALGTKTGGAYGTAFSTTAAASAVPGVAPIGTRQPKGFGKKGPQAPIWGPTGPQAPMPVPGFGPKATAELKRLQTGLVGRVKEIAPQMRAVGKGVLGVALISGIADAATREGIQGFGDRFQQFTSTSTLGFLPAPKDIDERLATIAAKIRAWKGGSLKLSDPSDPDNSLIRQKDLDDFTGRQRKMLTGLATLRNTATEFFGKDFRFTPKMEVNPEAAVRKLRTLENEFGRMESGAVLSVKELRQVTDANFQRIADTMGTGSREGQKQVARNFRLAVDSVVDFKKRGVLNASQAGKQIASLMKSDTGKGKDALAKNMLAAERAIAATMSKSGKITEQGTALIRALMVNAMKDMGLSPDTIRMSLNKRESAKKGPVTPGQTGMVVTGGKPTGDSVHAVLERDEVVLNRKAVKNLGGPRAVDQLNRIFPRFQTGGIVGLRKGGVAPSHAASDSSLFDGHPSNVAAGVRKLIEVMKGKWPGLGVSSTTDHSLRTTSGNISDHSTGHAVDLASTDYGYMNQAASWIKSSGLYRQISQGIHNPNLAIANGQIQPPPGQYAGHTWTEHLNHIHLAIQGALDAAGLGGKNGGFAGTVAPKLAHLTVTGGGGVGALVQGGLGKVRDAAQRKLNRLARTAGGAGSLTGFSGGGSAAKNRQLGKKMAAAFGWTGAEWSALDKLWTGESGWINQMNQAGSGATGIPQALPGSKMASEGADWATNPATQIRWGLKYIKGRYGDPINAYNTWLARNPHWYAKGGVVGYAGDSLGVGTVPKLKGLLDRKIDANVLSGRSSASGLAAMKGMLSKDHSQFVFDLGTNDGSAGQLSSSLKAADKATGHRPLHALTVLGPDAGQKNAALRALVGGDIDLVDWAKVAGQYVGSDPQKIHPNDDGYQRRAQMIASAIRNASAREELTKGQRKQIRKAGRGTLGQQFAQTIKSLKHLSAHTKFGKLMRNKRVHSLADKLKGFGVLPGHLDDKIRILTGGVDEYGDYADLASQLNVDNDNGTTSLGAFRGHDEPFWLQGQLSRLWSLRNFLADAQKILNDRREQLAAMAARVRKLVHQTQVQIGELVDRRHALEKRLVQLKKNPKVNRKLIDETEFALKQAKQTLSNKVGTRKDLNRVLGDSDHGLVGTRAKMGTALSETVVPGLEAVQGKGGPQGRLSALPALGGLGGSLFEVQLRLRDLAAPTTATDNSPVTGESAELLKQLLREANLRTAVSEKQFDVLRDFQAAPPFGGSFKDGGVVPGPIGAPRTAIVHGGETVTPVGGDGPRVRVVVEDHRTRVFVDDVEQVVEGVVRGQAHRADRALGSRGGGILR